ncbi:MAG: hypothetical protein OJF52_002144 [Nitrospira sp.]|nr:MAG: hypothetical protein OJF52_002144 [Nitrospira sp.]
MRGEQLLVRRGGILAAPIRIAQQHGRGITVSELHRERLLREITLSPDLIARPTTAHE